MLRDKIQYIPRSPEEFKLFPILLIIIIIIFFHFNFSGVLLRIEIAKDAEMENI